MRDEYSLRTRQLSYGYISTVASYDTCFAVKLIIVLFIQIFQVIVVT